NRVVNALTQSGRIVPCFRLDLVAGTHQALVGRVAVFVDHAGQLAGGTEVHDAFFSQSGGDVVQRAQAAIGDDALDQHHEQDDAEGEHQLRLQFEGVDPLHWGEISDDKHC